MPENMFDVSVKIISQQGTCACQHKVGDEWLLGRKTPAGLCLSAFGAVFPYTRVLAFGGSFSWDPAPDVARIACPDVDNPVVFELRRLYKTSIPSKTKSET